MHFEFLVEEESAEVALNLIAPKILGNAASFTVRRFQGKPDLLKALPQRLAGYRKRFATGNIQNWRIVVLIDEDRQNCHILKQQLEQIAAQAGLITRTVAKNKAVFQVLNRIVVEELEAWFFGDIKALCKAYPKIPSSLTAQKRYRNPDAITGGTWETLARLLKAKGYYSQRMPKIEVARRIATEMNPEENCSPSFQILCNALLEAIAQD